jgi:hypothetical protein
MTMVAAACLVFGAAVGSTGCSVVSGVSKAAHVANALSHLDKDSQKIDAQLKASQHLTYKATYQATTADGKEKGDSVVYEQKPPKGAYKANGFTFIDDGQNAINCSQGLDPSRPDAIGCLSTPGAAGAPGAGSQAAGGGFFLFSSVAVLAGFEALAIIPGISVSHGSRDVAGQHTDCAKLSGKSDGKEEHFEVCTTADGILGYYDDGSGDVFSLTDFTKSVSDADFVPPATPITQQELQQRALDQATSTTSTSSTTSTTGPDTTSSTSSTDVTSSTTMPGP